MEDILLSFASKQKIRIPFLSIKNMIVVIDMSCTEHSSLKYALKIKKYRKIRRWLVMYDLSSNSGKRYECNFYCKINSLTMNNLQKNVKNLK